MLSITWHGRVCLVAAFIACLPAEAIGQATRMEVRRLETAAYDTGDAQVAGFRWKVDLRVTNLSEASVDLPNPESGASGGTVRTALDNAQYRQPNGTWVTLIATTIVWTTDTKFEPCVSLPPGASMELKDVRDGLVLPRNRLAELGDRPTMRLTLWIGCTKPGGKGAGMFVRTEPFIFELPASTTVQQDKVGR